MPRGGHFAALEQPQLLVDDIHAFFEPCAESAARAIRLTVSSQSRIADGCYTAYGGMRWRM